MTQAAEKTFDYVLVGGGMASGYAATGIREEDQTGTIAILSSDKDIPYERPALTKKLWTDDEFSEDEIPITTEEESGFVIQYETVVTAIDKANHTVTTKDGTTVGYKKLLLATGGEPLELDGPEDEHVVAFRSWDDYRTVRRFAENEQDKDIIIVGGSYIGTELAANLTGRGHTVHFVYPEEILGSNRFPEEIANEFEQAYREAGVDMKPGTRADSYTIKDGRKVVQLNDGSSLEADLLILGIGVEPRLELAEEAGLEVDEGVVVDEYFRTSDPDIYAAGDIAYYPDPILGKHRIEHVDHARQSGSTVGKIMAGADQPYHYTPYFYSNVFDISWKAIGTLDPELDILIDPVDDGKVVYYLENDKPVGILTWNVEPDLDDVRELLKNPPSTSAALNGAIQNKEE